MVHCCCGSRAWRALMRRNLIYRRRNWFGTFLEITLPVFFLAILLIIKEASPGSLTADTEPEIVPDDDMVWIPLSFQDYLTAVRAKHICEEQYDFYGETLGLGITGQLWRGWNWMVPMVKCDTRKCEYPGQDASEFCEYAILALSGTDEGGLERAQVFKDWIYQRYPELSTDMPFEFNAVQIFNSSGDIDSYVRCGDYGHFDVPKIFMGIVWEGNDPNDYSYRLRQNQTNFNSPKAQGRPAVKTTPDTSKTVEKYSRGDFDTCVPNEDAPEQGILEESCTGQYAYNGILTMQRLVGDFILNATGAADSGYAVAEAGVRFVQFPAPSYEEDGFYQALAGFGPLLVLIGLLYPAAIMISYVTREKELRQKELMKMMSVTETDIGWSWFVTFMALHFFTALFSTFLSSALYIKSEGIYLFVYWLFTFWAVINLCSAVSSTSSKTVPAVLLGLLFLFFGVILPNIYNYEDGDSGVIALISLHPIAAFGFGMQEIGYLEDKGVGVTSETWDDSAHPSGYSFKTTLGTFIVDIILWGFVSWYLNRVIKPAYGQPLPVHFPFTLSYWFPEAGDGPITVCEEELLYDVDVPFEPVTEHLKEQAAEGKSIEIRNLRKTFGDNLAVDEFSLSLYSGQVTALLGHNGAGKTTVLNMLTGALSPTSGTAIVAGKDVNVQVHQIRQDIGICLQQNCLFPLLTTREHIQFFSRVKGVYAEHTREEAEHLVDQALRDIALMEKRDTLSKHLSGGMMRKLSVAIAFCGGSKIVLLDEPTSGMDPFSRRFTWDIIRHYRQDRCIILTTHFLDEADILGDRIAIMAEGHLRCCGSSLFLKKTYGVGYQLTVETDVGLEVGVDVDEIVRSNVKRAVLLSEGASEVKYQLPMTESQHFLGMFDRLDHEVDMGTVVSYGISMTTLDEVFLLVTRGHTSEKKEFPSSSFKIAESRQENSKALRESHVHDEVSDKIGGSKMDLEKDELFLVHLKALFRKRAAYFRRDKRAWCCTTIIPTVFVLVGLIIYKIASRQEDYGAVELSLNSFNSELSSDQWRRNPVVFNEAGESFQCQPGHCAYSRHGKTKVTQTNEMDYFCGYQGQLNSSASCTIDNSESQIEYIGGDLASIKPVAVKNIFESSVALTQEKDSGVASQYGAIFYTHENSSMLVGDGSLFSDRVKSTCLKSTSSYANPYICDRFGGVGYTIQYNYTAYHVSPLFQGLADEALVRDFLDSDEFSARVIIDPLPVTTGEATFGEVEDVQALWTLLVMSFPFIGGAFGSFVVSERESKAKHLQTVAGVKPSAYWLSTFLWDTLNYQVPCWITIGLFYAMGVDVLTTTKRHVASGVIVLLFLYGPAAASFSYFASFAFKSPSLCNLAVIVSGFVFGMGGAITIFILEITAEYEDPENPNDGMKAMAEALSWILRIFPAFCLANGSFRVAAIDFYEYQEGEDLTAWTEPILLADVIFLLLESVLYLLLAIQLDVWSSNPRAVSVWQSFVSVITCKWACKKKKEGSLSITTALPDDDDVLAEQERVVSGGANDDLIVLSQLTKVYGNEKLAVNNMSLGIPPGECFGLLGINGAGKTTTLAMLTAEFPPTSGDATLAGFSVTNEPEKTRRRVGYCPQFDALFANLTGREHVQLYAAIKGIPRGVTREACQDALDKVGLKEEDADRLADGYSGGMKRRLSLACALIGQPQILFLDEATTGVDPVSRRDIWQLISDMVGHGDTPHEDRTSVILTSHSMEESEALCSRIGIMTNGRLRCLGSALHLKTKFGQGYQVELRVALVERSDADYFRIEQGLWDFIDARGVEQHPDEGRGAARNSARQDPSSAVFNLVEVQEVLRLVAGDCGEYLVNMISPHNSNGYRIWRNASCGQQNLEDLAGFCALELRIQKVDVFVRDAYPRAVLCERQDAKARYEVSSEGIRISEIFRCIESSKDELKIADYGVCQTSLEQVFNTHAAEAEKLKLA